MENTIFQLLSDVFSFTILQVYLVLSIAMVLLSIGVLVVSTHPIGQTTHLDKDQWKEYMGTDYDDYSWYYSINETYDVDYEYPKVNYSERLHILEKKYPDVFAVKSTLILIGDITAVYFTVELFVRFIICPHKCHFLLSFFNVIDILAVLFAGVIMSITYACPSLKYQDSLLHLLYVTQILRILRLFRILRHSVVFQVLVYATLGSLNELLMVLTFFFIFTLIFSSLSYFAMERNFNSIPDAMWWAVVTMTTVGYGDITPGTVQGKVIGSICAITGICLLAILIPVFVNNFLLLKAHVSQMNQSDTQESASPPIETKVHSISIQPDRDI